MEGHVGEEEEESPVDVGDAFLSQFLPEVDGADEEGDDLSVNEEYMSKRAEKTNDE